MSLRGIIAISGESGLYKVVAQAKNGFIVESVIDNRRFPISSTQRISALEDISVYTTEEDKPLKEIFLIIKEQIGDNIGIDPKKADNNALKAFFKKVLPNYDEERVYVSDIKKVITWYSLLKDLVGKEEEPAEVEVAAEEKPVKKTAKTVEEAPTAEEKKPAKKTTAKKTETTSEEKPAKAKAEKTEAKKAPAKSKK